MTEEQIFRGDRRTDKVHEITSAVSMWRTNKDVWLKVYDIDQVRALSIWITSSRIVYFSFQSFLWHYLTQTGKMETKVSRRVIQTCPFPFNFFIWNINDGYWIWQQKKTLPDSKGNAKCSSCRETHETELRFQCLRCLWQF